MNDELSAYRSSLIVHGSSFLLAAFPISQELLDPDIGQRVLHTLLEHLERAGGDIGAGQRRVDNMARVADRGRQYHGLDLGVVAVDLHDLADELHALHARIIYPANERADDEGARPRGEQRLIGVEA